MTEAWGIDYLEIIGDELEALEEALEWLAYEEDMATNPYED